MQALLAGPILAKSGSPKAQPLPLPAGSFLLALLLLLIPGAASAQFTYAYSTDAMGFAITSYTGPGGDVVIPSTINGNPILAIGPYAFYTAGGAAVTSVTIPDGLKFIFNHAFYVCTNLASVTIPGSVLLIDTGAFQFCSALTNVVLQQGLTTIGNNAFYACSALTNIVLPQSLTTIGSGAFQYCSALANVVLPQGLITIGSSAFQYCNSLTTVAIPGSVTSIGTSPFGNCASLTNISAQGSAYTSTNGVLFNGTRTVLVQYPNGRAGSYAVPSSVTSVAAGAFASSSHLTRVTFFPGVTSIGDTAFAGCPSLRGVYFYGNAPTLGGALVFSGDSNLTIYYQSGTTGWTSTFGGFPTAPWTALPYYYQIIGSSVGITKYTGTAATVNIPFFIENLPVVNLGDRSFYNNNYLTSVTIPGLVTNIGDYAFAYCPYLHAASTPYSLISIGSNAFQSCTALIGLSMPSGLVTIGDFAFAYSGVWNVTIPDSVTNLGTAVFEDSSVYSLTFGSGITTIPPGTCYNCTYLTFLTLPSSLLSIDDWAFYGCDGLDSSLTIPSGVTNIGDYAFYGCTRLPEVNIPSSVVAIGFAAFQNCQRLTAINVDPLNTNYSSLRGVLFDENQTTLIQFPGGVAGSYRIPDGVTALGSGAFAYSPDLYSVTAPASLASIGSAAFVSCGNLRKVFFLGNAPAPGNDPGAFTGDTGVTVYYQQGTGGWGPTFDGLPTVMLHPSTSTSFFVGSTTRQTNQFCFSVNSTSNQLVVVEASTDLSQQTWVPVSTNMILQGATNFCDPDLTNFPARFYRLRSP